jgi:NadR type nicotinamide-nucleotide adenylyltransferase
MEKITRVCLIGPESTGKSELAAELAQHYGAPVVPEYAREYAVAHGNDLTYADVDPIAKGEMAAIDAARARTPRLLIEDTDLISTVVYSRYYYNKVPDWVVEEARKRKADLYLLMDTDIEWKADPARDAGGEAREELFDLFRRALDEFACRFVIVSGNREERFARAVEAVDTRGVSVTS